MNVIICDDKEQITKELKDKVKNLLPTADVLTFASGDELLHSKQKMDILLLDIKMPDMNGMEIARQIREKDKQTILIFVTGTEEYVFQAFDVGAFHYLVKPFSDEKFTEVMKRAYEEYNKSNKAQTEKESCIMINSNGVHRKILLDNIIFAEVFNRIVLIHEKEEETQYYGSLSDLEAMVGKTFFRTHRSYLVNLKYVTKYDSTHVSLLKGEAPIAKAKYPMFVKEFLRYNKRGC